MGGDGPGKASDEVAESRPLIKANLHCQDDDDENEDDDDNDEDEDDDC